MNKEFMKGYVFGLIVGESSFSGDKSKPRLSIKMKNDLNPLKVCQQLLGGRIHGPYNYTGKDGTFRTYSMWCLDGSNLLKTLSFIEENLPESRKKEQFIEWKKHYNL